MTPEEYTERAYRTPITEALSEEDQREQHALNVRNCVQAAEEFKIEDRPLRILAIHASGRDRKDSCAQAQSNSKLLLQKGLDAIDPKTGIEIEELSLRDREYNRIEGCNSCVSTASALCHFPCSCYPLATEGAQLIYPKILRADVLLFSSGVKQSAMDARLKILLERLISLDGGYFLSAESWAPKDEKMRDRMIALSQSNVVYDPRMFGRVAAYFITSKDQHNPATPQIDYVRMVAESMYIGNSDFGMFHPEPYYVGWGARPNEDYSHDHARLLIDDETAKASRDLVERATAMAMRFRREGYPAWDGGRENRT